MSSLGIRPLARLYYTVLQESLVQLSAALTPSGTLETSGAQTAGAGTLALTASVSLSGVAMPGDTFTISATVYTVQKAAIASGNVITVNVTPVVASAYAGNTAATGYAQAAAPVTWEQAAAFNAHPLHITAVENLLFTAQIPTTELTSSAAANTLLQATAIANSAVYATMEGHGG